MRFTTRDEMLTRCLLPADLLSAVKSNFQLQSQSANTFIVVGDCEIQLSVTVQIDEIYDPR